MEKLLVIIALILPMTLSGQRVIITDTLADNDRQTIIRVQKLDTSEVVNSYIFDLKREIEETERMIKELQAQRNKAIRRLRTIERRIQWNGLTR